MLGKTATITTSASVKVFPGQYYDQETGLWKYGNKGTDLFLSYSYDSYGNVTSHQGVDYSYDLADRVKTMTYPSAMKLTYHYDLAGQVGWTMSI